MVDVQGSCDDRFEPVRGELAEQLESGNELGASIVVDVDGRTVVDLWGGWCDAEHRRPWAYDTITNVWSTTKTVTNLAALVLVDRGLLDPFAPVAKFWPEFAANGKDRIEVRHAEAVHDAGFVWVIPLTFVSSALVPVDSMPEAIQPLARLNPVTSVADSVRALLLGDPAGTATVHALLWIAGLLAVFVPLAVRAYQKR